MQKLVLHKYQLNFSLGFCGLLLFNDFKHNLLFNKVKKYTQISHTLLVLTSNSIPNNFLKISDALWASQFEFKVVYETVQLEISFALDCGATAKQWLATNLRNQNKADRRHKWAVYVFSYVFALTPFHFDLWFIYMSDFGVWFCIKASAVKLYCFFCKPAGLMQNWMYMYLHIRLQGAFLH